MPQSNHKRRFELTGGNVCLDFVNTVDSRTSGKPEDRLTSYGDLLRWAQQCELLNRKQAERLSARAAETPGTAQSALRSATQVREAIFDIFSAVAERRGTPGSAMGVLNHAVRRAFQNAHVVYANRQFLWEWMSPEEHLDSVLWPIARAAAELLTSEELGFVRTCAAADCGWLFLDRTKNHRRRWCDMKSCGNRDKARRYYRRIKTE
jgi:predicted RNA-binding Zn ribbon-like protein